MNSIKKILEKNKIKMPILEDYFVRISPGGKTSALVETVITWKGINGNFRTRGVDTDQVISAIKSTEKC